MLRLGLALCFVALVGAPVSAKQMLVSGAPAPQAVACKMVYGGGALIQHVKVFDIFYSANMADRDKYADFYTAILESAHVDMLQEYNVANYKIGRGSYIGMYEDSKPVGNPMAPTTLSDPAAYLKGLITAGTVPMPDDDTLYMIYFPPGIDPMLNAGGQSANSCADLTNPVFCAYHNSFLIGSQIVRFGVMPDGNAGGCKGLCGANPTAFQNMTDVSSHELIEAMTDPDDNTAWVDPKQGCGEIGDICATNSAAEVGTVAGYTVQKEWSNKLNACVVSNPSIVVNDFTMALSSISVNVPVGGMATTTVTLTKTGGIAESATLSATGVPTGLVAAFSPTSLTSGGGTSMLTLTAAPTVMVGQTATFTVKAAGTVVSPTQKVTVTYVSPPDMAMPPSGGGGGGNGDKGGGCSVAGGNIAGSWAMGALLLVALAFRRRRA
jgi:MYXO-CTERM domain-containing protein